MKTSRVFAILGVALGGLGCSTLTVGSMGSMSSRGWLAGHAKQDLLAGATDGTSGRVFVTVESQTDVQLRNADGAIVPIEALRQVTGVDHAQGALDGLQVGAIGGFLTGLGVGLVILETTQPDGDCFGCKGPGPGLVFGASGVGLLVGVFVSTVLGAMIGHSDVLEFK